jgi:dinuclear metal center YbgI/SA1388 family protein
MTTSIRDLIHHLETIAPAGYQEEYDNAGLIVGDPTAAVRGVLVCLDSTEAVLDEALAMNCNVVVAHHPIVFKGLKRITGRNYVERVILKAIKNDIAIFAIHTNLDNMYVQGVNTKIAEQLGLVHTRILAPKRVLKRLEVYLPQPEILAAILQKLNLEQVQVVPGKLEVIFSSALEREIIGLVQKETPTAQWQVWPLETASAGIGAGIIGELPQAMSGQEFLGHLKSSMQVNVVRHTALLAKEVRKIAVCGGAGGFLLSQAIQQGADFFVTADYKYHEFFDADGHLTIADIGHYESEQFTVQLLQEIISQKFSNFAAYCTKVNTNPVFYF